MIEVPAQAVRGAFSEFLKETWGLGESDAIQMAQRSLKNKAMEVRKIILISAITDHPLFPIIDYILTDVIDHSAAIDLLGKSKSSLLHIRHIEEVCTIATFVLTEKARHQEFGWRWRNFERLHAIRNRILNLKQPLDDLDVAFLKANIKEMKAFLNKKFEVDETRCIGQWEKLSNWMMDIQLKDVFENAGRKQSYISAAYDWNSQAVHLSPLGGQYLGFKLEHFDFGDFVIEAASDWVLKLCHNCAPIVTDQDRLRDYYFQQVMVDMYAMLDSQAGRYMGMAAKGGSYGAVTEEILKKPFRIDYLRNAAIGAPPLDPYVLNFAVAAGAAAPEI